MIEAIGGTTILGVIGVLVLAASSLMGLVFFVNKEEKFEDVVAAQRKEHEALINSLQAPGKSSKGNKKWSKIKSKKAAKKAENEEPEIDSGVDDEEPSTESVILPPPSKDAPPKEKKENKSSKQEGKKSEVKKTEDKKAEEKKVEDKKAEEKKVEDKKTEDKKQEKSKKQKKGKPAIVEEDFVIVQKENKVEAAPPPVIEETIAPKSSQKTMAAPPQTESTEKASKKAKSGKNKPAKVSSKNKDSGVVSANKLISEVEESPLNSSEVQQLIDVLLAKQSENEQWQKPKGDPLENMKKQLSEIDVQLHEERKLAQSAALKNKDLKNELQQERGQRQNLQQMITRYAQQTKEHESARKQVEEKHMSEMQSTQAQITRMQQLIDGGSQREFQQLAEENQHMKRAQQQINEEKKKLMNDVSQLQKSQQSMKQEYDNAVIQFQQKDQQQKSLQDKVVYYEKELQIAQKSKHDGESTLSKSLQEVQEKLLQTENRNKSLEQEVGTLKTKETESLQNSAPPPQEEVSKLSQILLQTEAELSQSQLSMKELLAQVEKKNALLQNQESEKADLQAQMNTLKSTVEVSKSGENKLTTEVGSLQKSLKDKDAQLELLNKQNGELTSQLKNAKNTPVEQTPVPALNDEKLKELENALAESTAQNKKLEDDVDGMKKKNNDLREKNWKAMDALGKSESEAQKKEKSLEKTIFKSLKSLHPDMKLPKNEEGLENFFEQYNTMYKEYSTEKEGSTRAEIETLRLANEDLQKQLGESNEQKKTDGDSEGLDKMKSENAQLKSVLNDTENMLSRLQSGVDAEVKKWQDKVDTKDQELGELKTKMASMEDAMKEHGFVQEDLTKKVESLTEALQQEKEDKFNLSIKLTDLEKSYQEEQPDKDKILNLESKLNAAEAKVTELESKRNSHIENEIEDAMKQAAAGNAGADIGTSV